MVSAIRFASKEESLEQMAVLKYYHKVNSHALGVHRVLRMLESWDLVIYVYCFPLFDLDAFTHHVLHLLDAPVYQQ